MPSAEVIAYTDGGCRGNPGLGAWAYVLINPKTGQAIQIPAKTVVKFSASRSQSAMIRSNGTDRPAAEPRCPKVSTDLPSKV